ncbi:MAG TPA: DUF2203 domain-containing protein [Gaiellales bacterium]
MPERTFTLAEAQALLDATIRPLAERLAAVVQELTPLQRQWQKIVIAIGSNGGGLDHERAGQLRERLESGQAEVQELIREITDHGVQVKDPAQGLLDFPAVVDGEEALLCWHVGEARIAFWHSPEDGFAGRRPLP